MTKNIYRYFLFLICFFLLQTGPAHTQSTYTIGSTEYYYNSYYTTTGRPMVKRSEANKRKFLAKLGYKKVPRGYEIDHIIPLSEGGSDDPSNMQLLTKEAHERKTARERAARWRSTSTSRPYFSKPTYSTRIRKTQKILYTGPKGGRYYYNSKGKKVYVGR